jgi:glutaredoxin
MATWSTAPPSSSGCPRLDHAAPPNDAKNDKQGGDAMTGRDTEISVYWQTGCTSCLRTKEFLTRHKVPFRSRNVLEDESAFDELAKFGLRQVPIVTRGDRWANGQILRDVAELCEIDLGAQAMLAPAELHQRLRRILDGIGRFYAQIPPERTGDQLPDRPRSYAELYYHTVNVIDAFLEHEEQGVALTYEAYYRLPGADMQDAPSLLAYGADVRARLDAWFAGPGRAADWSRKAEVYYGEQSLHDFLERTTWHAGQHARQLMWIVERLGLTPDGPLGEETFRGLPMPERVWDGEPVPA